MAPIKNSKPSSSKPLTNNSKLTDFFTRSSPPSSSAPRPRVQPRPPAPGPSQLIKAEASTQSNVLPAVRDHALKPSASPDLPTTGKGKAPAAQPPLPHPRSDNSVISIPGTASIRPAGSVISISSSPLNPPTVISLSSGSPRSPPGIIDLCSSSEPSIHGPGSAIDLTFTSSEAEGPALPSSSPFDPAVELSPPPSPLATPPKSEPAPQPDPVAEPPPASQTSITSTRRGRVLLDHVEIISPRKKPASTSTLASTASLQRSNSSFGASLAVPIPRLKISSQVRSVSSSDLSSAPLSRSSSMVGTLRTRTPSAQRSSSPARPTPASGRRKVKTPKSKGKTKAKRKRVEDDELGDSDPDEPIFEVVVAVPRPRKAAPASSQRTPLGPKVTAPSAKPTPTKTPSTSRPAKRQRRSSTPPPVPPLPANLAKNNAHLPPLPSSQGAENTPPLETEEVGRFGWHDDAGVWDEGNGDGGDWDMDADVGEGWKPAIGAVEPIPDAATATVEEDAPPVDTADTAEVPSLSYTPTVPSSALPTPPEPPVRLSKAEQLIADIRARARQVALDEQEDEPKPMEIDFGIESDDELEDLDAVMKGGKGKGKQPARARTTRSPSSSPLTDLDSPTPPLNRSLKRSASPSPLPGTTVARKSTRLSNPRPSPVPPPIAGPSKPAKAKRTAPLPAPQKNSELTALLRVKQSRDRAGGASELVRKAEAALRASKEGKQQGHPPSPPATPSHPLSPTNSASSSPSSTEIDLASKLEIEDKEAEEMRRIFEDDRAERRAARERVEDAGTGVMFWSREGTGARNGVDYTPKWIENVDLTRAVHDAINTCDAVTLSFRLEIATSLSSAAANLQAERWLFTLATHHTDATVAHAAHRQLLQIIRRPSAQDKPTIIGLSDWLRACQYIGVTREAMNVLVPGVPVSNPPADQAGETSVGDRVWIMVSTGCALASSGRLPVHAVPDTVFLLLLMGLDPSSSTDVRCGIMLALNDALNAVPEVATVSIEFSIRERILAFASSLSPAEQCAILAMLPRYGPRSIRLSRWVAAGMVVPSLADTLTQGVYVMPPPLSELRATISDTPPSPWAIVVDTDYELLYWLAVRLDGALTDIPSYVQSSESHRKELDALMEMLQAVYGKIVDTRAAYLNRTRAKDFIMRMRLRIVYQTPSAATEQSKLPFGKKPRPVLKQKAE